MTAIIAITGLAAEARIARGAGWRAIATGGDTARTEAAARRAVAEGATVLVSFGICGGLDPTLASGSLLLPRVVLDRAGTRYRADRLWRDAAASVLGAAALMPAATDLLGIDAIASSGASKATLQHRHGAAGVDLESHIVAREALRAGLPFIVLRAVADPAMCDLPPAARLPLGGRGQPRIAAVLGSVLRQPAQLPQLVRVARDARMALSSLSRAATALRELLTQPPVRG